MKGVKQAKLAGMVVMLAVLAGCAGQVNEEAGSMDPSAIGGSTLGGSSINGQSSGQVDEAMAATVEQLKANAMAADTLFFFEFDKSDLSPEALDDLDTHAKFLVANPNGRVRLEGHADERGSRAYNLALGERRSNAVARYLVIQGVDRSQIETISYGEERPLSLIRDESGWARNRRVELMYQ